MTRLTFLLAFLILLAPVAASAATINDEGAARLKTIFTSLIDRQRAANEMAGRILETRGDIEVEKADSYYAVTLPYITLLDAQGNRGNIGMIAINATPDETPGNWKFSVALPTPIAWAKSDGTPLNRFDIKTQRFSGIWNEKLENFVKLDAAYEGISFHDFQKSYDLKISSLAAIMDLKETKPDIWSGVLKATTDSITGVSANNQGNMSADSSTSVLQILDFSAKDYKQMREKLAAFRENTSPDDAENMSDDAQLAFFDMIHQTLKNAGNGFKFSTSLKNVKFTAPAIAGLATKTVTFRDFAIGYDMTGFREENIAFGLRTAYNNLKISPATAEEIELIPSTLNVNLSLDKVPFDALMDFGKTTLQGLSGGNKVARHLAGIHAMMMLPGLFSDSGTQLHIRDTYAENDNFRTAIEGTVSADKDSPFGATGKANALIAGLPSLIDIAKRRQENAEPASKPRLDETVRHLIFLDLIGSEAPPVNGKPTKTYDLSLAKSGQFLLNGKDFAQLIKARQEAAAPPAAKPETQPSPAESTEDIPE